MGEINVVPYIDVMLVLLIIFMVTAPLLSQGIKVDLPRDRGAEPIDPRISELILLSVEPTRTDVPESRRSGSRAVARAGASSSSARRCAGNPSRPVLVKADKAVPYGRVVEGMVLLQQAGARKVGFVTQPVQSDARGAGAALNDAWLRS